MPFALANIYSLIAVANGCKRPPKLPEVLRSWGLTYEASRMDEVLRESREAETVRAFEMAFGPFEVPRMGAEPMKKEEEKDG